MKIHFFCLLLSLSSFHVSLAITSTSKGIPQTQENSKQIINPFSPKASLIRYWNKHISNKQTIPHFLLSKGDFWGECNSRGYFKSFKLKYRVCGILKIMKGLSGNQNTLKIRSNWKIPHSLVSLTLSFSPPISLSLQSCSLVLALDLTFSAIPLSANPDLTLSAISFSRSRSPDLTLSAISLSRSRSPDSWSGSFFPVDSGYCYKWIHWQLCFCQEVQKEEELTVAKKDDSRAYFTWNLEMDRALADILRDLRSMGNKSDGAWKAVAYNTAAQMLSSRFNLQLIGENVKNCIKLWRSWYGIVSDILSQSGFDWDGTKYMISVTKKDYILAFMH